MLRIARRAASRASWSGEGSMAMRGWTTGATAKAERDLAEARASLRTSRAAWTRVDMSPPESLRARSCTRACFLRSPRHRSSPPGLGLRLGLGLGPGLGLGSGFGAGLGLGFWHISFSPPPPPLVSSPLLSILYSLDFYLIEQQRRRRLRGGLYVPAVIYLLLLLRIN